MEENKEFKIKEFFSTNIFFFIIGLASVIYLVSGLIQIDTTGKSITQIFADAFLILIFGIAITKMFDLQGIMSGQKDRDYQKIISNHKDTVVKINPFIDKLDTYCEIKNTEALKEERTRILSKEGMKYSDYFDENGNPKEAIFKEYNKKTEKEKWTKENSKKKIYRKALRINLTKLTTNTLVSDGYKENDPYYFGETITQHMRKADIKGIVSKLLSAFIFGYFSVKFIGTFDYSYLIWTSLQVVFFISLGVLKYYRSFLFIVNDYKSRIEKKISNLEMFYIWAVNLKNESQKELFIDSTRTISEIEKEKENGELHEQV